MSVSMKGPIFTTCIVNKWLDVNSESETPMYFEIPRVGALIGLEIQCSKGARVIRRMRLIVGEASTVFDVPWPLGRKQRVQLPVGMAVSEGLVGIMMQNNSVNANCVILFSPGNYSVEFRLITQWVPIPFA